MIELSRVLAGKFNKVLALYLYIYIYNYIYIYIECSLNIYLYIYILARSSNTFFGGLFRGLLLP